MKDDNDSHNKPNDEPFKNTDKSYYQSLTHAVKAEDTLEDPNLNGYSSLENGEVRDEDDLEEEVEVKRNSLQDPLVINSDFDFPYGQSITKNVYQTEEANENPMI